MARQAAVDSNIPRGKALFHTILPAIGFIIGGFPGALVIGATGLAMLASVVFGPGASVLGRTFAAIRTVVRIPEGRLEDAAPHRFAELVGAVFLVAASALLLTGATAAGQTLTLAVVGLAALNASTGICVGCQMYLLYKRTQARVGA